MQVADALAQHALLSNLSVAAAREYVRQEPLAVKRYPCFHFHADNLAELYAAIGDDCEVSAPVREAAMMFAVAEEQLYEEDFATAMQTAGDALARFRDFGDSVAVADALRLVIRACHLTLRLQHDESDQPLQIAEEELHKFQAAGEKRGQAAMLLSIAEVHSMGAGARHQLDKARQVAKESQELYRELGDMRMVGATLLVICCIYRKQGSQRNALKAANQALQIFSDAGKRRLEAEALHEISITHLSHESFKEGLDAAQSALDIFRELEDRKLEAIVQLTIAKCSFIRGDSLKALPPALSALALLEELGHSRGWHMAALSLLVNLYLMGGQEDDAIQTAREGFELFEGAGDPHAETAAKSLLAHALLVLGSPAEALQLATDSLQAYQDAFDSTGRAHALLTVIEAHIDLGQHQEALQAAAQASSSFRVLDDPKGEAEVALLVAIALLTEETEEAELQAQEARRLFHQVGDKCREAVALLVLANVQRKLRGEASALSMVADAQALFRREGDQKMEAKAMSMMAELQFSAGSSSSALRAAGRARHMYQEIGDSNAEAGQLVSIANIHLHLLVQTAKDAVAVPGESASKEAMSVAEEALELSFRFGDTRCKARALLAIARANFLAGRFSKVVGAAAEAASLAKECGDPVWQGLAMLINAQAHWMDQKSRKAHDALLSATRVFTQSADEVCKAAVQELEQVFAKSSHEHIDSRAHSEQKGDDLIITAEMVKPSVTQALHAVIGEWAVPADSPLMEAGVDSLASVEIQSELQERFAGIWLPVRLLRIAPTIAELAAFISNGIMEAGVSDKFAHLAAVRQSSTSSTAPDLDASSRIVGGIGVEGKPRRRRLAKKSILQHTGDGTASSSSATSSTQGQTAQSSASASGGVPSSGAASSSAEEPTRQPETVEQLVSRLAESKSPSPKDPIESERAEHLQSYRDRRNKFVANGDNLFAALPRRPVVQQTSAGAASSSSTGTTKGQPASNTDAANLFQGGLRDDHVDSAAAAAEEPPQSTVRQKSSKQRRAKIKMNAHLGQLKDVPEERAEALSSYWESRRGA